MDTKRLLYIRPIAANDVIRGGIASAGWSLETAYNIQEASARLQAQHYPVGLAFLDRVEPTDWSQFESLFSRSGNTQWIAVTSDEALRNDHICKLIFENFYAYHTLPPALEDLVSSLEQAYGLSILGNAEAQSRPEMDTTYGMVGESPELRAVFRMIDKYALVEAPVLISGESGTGKERIAHAIHNRSGRASGPFVAVNCGAFPHQLVQSELFGHEKGAFTGAYQRKIGRIEAAAAGTVFLDEIGDLPLDQQVNLLRFLQEKAIERVGSNESLPVDVRVIAATHVNLEQAIQTGKFREDLYFRLNVLHLRAPSLAERSGDIALLAHFFFHQFAHEKGKRVKGFSEDALRAMEQYHWPGNVRELMNRIRRAMVICEGRVISREDLGLERRLSPSPRALLTLEEARSNAEQNAIKASLRHARNNISQAARLLDVSRGTLYRLIKEYRMTTEWSH